jgi:predicted RNA-binding Zn-ribbon protein involved in translation (DUF1610 family)
VGDLKPCPFCGEQAAKQVDGGWCYCSGCHVPACEDEWNRRPIEDALKADVERLRAIFPRILASLGNGSACAPECSVEFFESIPNEVQAEVERLRADLEIAEVGKSAHIKVMAAERDSYLDEVVRLRGENEFLKSPLSEGGHYWNQQAMAARADRDELVGAMRAVMSAMAGDQKDEADFKAEALLARLSRPSTEGEGRHRNQSPHPIDTVCPVCGGETSRDLSDRCLYRCEECGWGGRLIEPSTYPEGDGRR